MILGDHRLDGGWTLMRAKCLCQREAGALARKGKVRVEGGVGVMQLQNSSSLQDTHEARDGVLT